MLNLSRTSNRAEFEKRKKKTHFQSEANFRTETLGRSQWSWKFTFLSSRDFALLFRRRDTSLRYPPDGGFRVVCFQHDVTRKQGALSNTIAPTVTHA